METGQRTTANLSSETTSENRFEGSALTLLLVCVADAPLAGFSITLQKTACKIKVMSLDQHKNTSSEVNTEEILASLKSLAKLPLTAASRGFHSRPVQGSVS